MKSCLVIVLVGICFPSWSLIQTPASIAAMGSGGNSFLSTDPFSVFYSSDASFKSQIAVCLSKPFRRFDLNTLNITGIKKWKNSQHSLTLSYFGYHIAYTVSATLCNRLDLRQYSVGALISWSKTNIQNYTALKQIKGSVYGSFKIDKHWQSFILFEINNESDSQEKTVHWNTCFALKYIVSPNTQIDILQELNAVSKNAVNISLVHQRKNGLELYAGYNFNRNAVGLGLKKRKGSIGLGFAILYNNFLGTGQALESHYAF